MRYESDRGTTLANPPAAWYPDPHDADQWRYWDGTAWTYHRAPRRIASGGSLSRRSRHAAGSAVASVAPYEGVVHDHAFPSDAATDQPPSLAEIVERMRLEQLRHPLDEQVEVAGETHHIKAIKRVFTDNGMPVTAAGTTLEDLRCSLVPERWNRHDPNAVAVMVGLHHVGYIPAELARDYSPPLLTLASTGVLVTGVARIWAKLDAGVARARVTVLLPEAHVLG